MDLGGDFRLHSLFSHCQIAIRDSQQVERMNSTVKPNFELRVIPLGMRWREH